MKTTSQAAVFRLQDSDISAGRFFTLMRRAIILVAVLWGVLSGAAALAAEDLDGDGDVDGRDLWQYVDTGIFADIDLFAGAYGGPDPGTGNLAADKTVTCSSQESENSAANVVDGNTTDTRWSGSINSYPQWVEIDLGGTYTINQTVLFPYNNRAYQYKVEVSTDGVGYTQVVDRTDNTTGGASITDNFSPTSARYVKLTVTGAHDYSEGWTSILEFEVYASEGGDTKAPSAPTDLISSNVTSNSVDLNWDAATDNVGVTGYDVYQNNSYLKNVPDTATTITGLSASTSYSFYVEAKDAAGNTSSASNTATITTEGGGTASDWPDATNTGYQAAPDYPGSLHACSGDSIQSNTTYNFCDFSGSTSVGSPYGSVENVTFHGCRFKAVAVGGALVMVYGDNITFDYSSFEPGVSEPPTPYEQSYQYGIAANGAYDTYVEQMTVTHSDFWGFGNAIDTEGSTQAKPQVFRDNYIHDASEDSANDDYHTDGIGDESGHGYGSYVVIDHNTIISEGDTNGIAFQQGSYDHFTITNNLFSGFGFTVALWAPAPYTTFTDNTYSTILRPVFGPLYSNGFATSEGSVWRRNRWHVPSGAAWGNPEHDGWYWIPTDYSISGSDDTPFVSQTDYGD